MGITNFAFHSRNILNLASFCILFCFSNYIYLSGFFSDFQILTRCHVVFLCTLPDHLASVASLVSTLHPLHDYPTLTYARTQTFTAVPVNSPDAYTISPIQISSKTKERVDIPPLPILVSLCSTISTEKLYQMFGSDASVFRCKPV